nr:hypothetical protein [Tanacetum cinerariifolium]
MVNTRTDAELSAAVQNALQTLLPQIRAEIREEFRTSSGPSDSGGNSPPVTIYTWLNALISKSPVHLRRQQLPWTRRIIFLTWRRSLMSWVVRMHSRLDWLCTSLRVMHLLGGKPISKPKVVIAAARNVEDQANNFQWGLRRSTLNHLMCIPFTDVAQVANAARNYEILHERDDDDAERPDKR